MWAELGTSLWRLGPANPIMLRVLHGSSRRGSHFYLRLGYLCVLFITVLVGMLRLSGGEGALNALARGATRVFELVALFQLALICLLAPVFAAAAISQEKDSATFSVLLTTPLTNAQIVVGSLMSRILLVFVLLVAGLPIFGITMLFGGVTAEQIFATQAVAGATALLAGSIAILVSVTRLGTRGTVFAFYLGIALYLAIGLGLGFLPSLQVGGSGGLGEARTMPWLALVHPYWAQATILGHAVPPARESVGDAVWPFGSMLTAPAGTYVALASLASVGMVTAATLFVRRGVKLGESTLLAWIPLPWRRVRITGAEPCRPARHVWSNPVAWREATTRASVVGSQLLRATYLTLGLLALVMFLSHVRAGAFANTVTARAWLTWIVTIEFALVVLMAANNAATAMTREREQRTLDLLLCTPLSSRYIVWGKARGLVSFAVGLMAVPAGTVVVVAIAEWARGSSDPIVGGYAAVLVPILLVLYATFTCMVGLTISLRNRRSIPAALVSVGVVVATAMVLGLVGIGAVSASPQIGALIAPLSFVASVVFALNPGWIVTSAGSAFAVTPGTVATLGVVGTLMAIGLYGAIIIGSYRVMVAGFDAVVRRQTS